MVTEGTGWGRHHRSWGGAGLSLMTSPGSLEHELKGVFSILRLLSSHNPYTAYIYRSCYPILLFYILATSTNLWQCTLMVTLKCFPNGRPDHQHHDLLSHSVPLFWHWANQSLTYANNVEHLDKKWQESILKSLVWLDHGWNLRGSNPPISQNGVGHSLVTVKVTIYVCTVTSQNMSWYDLRCC